MVAKKEFLSGAYEVESAEQTLDLYKEWAETYDEELAANGYASPRRTAEALIACGADTEARVLDIGCGSGVSGVFLKQAGFTHIDGSDFSAEMLQEAEKKHIYDNLHRSDFTAPFDFITTPYPTMTAVGVFTVGHADADVLRAVIDLLPRQGMLAFSLNDHAIDEGSYEAVIVESVKRSTVRLRWQEYGEHLPGVAMQSMVYVLQKR